MAVPAGLGTLVLDAGPSEGPVSMVVLNQGRAIIRTPRYQQVIKTDSDIGLHLTIKKVDSCRLALTHLLFKLCLTIRYIGTLVHIAALRRDLTFFMR